MFFETNLINYLIIIQFFLKQTRSTRHHRRKLHRPDIYKIQYEHKTASLNPWKPFNCWRHMSASQLFLLLLLLFALPIKIPGSPLSIVLQDITSRLSHIIYANVVPFITTSLFFNNLSKVRGTLCKLDAGRIYTNEWLKNIVTAAVQEEEGKKKWA